ncbi:MAG: UDP-2,3-diacylglucosamine diphosphatase [Chitinispirillales bacterium]|jgi:UDP-2,3-diacylglucosamine hydrolase|nr:UDP-2,3-diacylglucosamine diphosphatase [Chitinispirillales bacterium]
MTSGSSGKERDAVYFVSDAHFGLGDDGRRVELFAELAAQMRGRAAALYIAGDLFDFWIEYRRTIRSDYFRVLHELRALVEAGVSVHYAAGNHDFALGRFLEETVGIKISRGCIDVELQGREVHICHGDRIRKRYVFKIADRLLGNKTLQAVYRMIHPDIGVSLGAFCSAVLKERNRKPNVPSRNVKVCRQAAQALVKTGKSDLVIFAHTHYAERIKYDGGEYCNIGSWVNNYDYAVLRGGEIQLLKWGNSAS